MQFKELGYEFNTTINKYVQTSSNPYLNANLLVSDNDTLKDMYMKINEVYGWYKSQCNLPEHSDLRIDEFKGNPVSRSYKVYPDIQLEFKMFCEDHRQYKVQDLVSQAFKNFIEKYTP